MTYGFTESDMMDLAGILTVRMPALTLKSLNSAGLTLSGLPNPLWSLMSALVRISPPIAGLPFTFSAMVTSAVWSCVFCYSLVNVGEFRLKITDLMIKFV